MSMSKEDNFSNKEENPMKSQRIPVVLTRQEVESLITVAEKDIETSQTAHQRFNAVRNVAILRLFWSTGLRVQEACNLNLNSIFPEEKRIKVRFGKFGNNDYQRIQKKETWEALEEYLLLRNEVDGKGQALFISFYGQRILARQMNRYLKGYASQARIPKNVHAHTLRHSFLTEYWTKTNNLLATQKVARHKNIASTLIYTHIYDKDIEEGLIRANL